jgi:HrpA-like RNA helicase
MNDKIETQTFDQNEVLMICDTTGSELNNTSSLFLYKTRDKTLRTQDIIVIAEPRRVSAVNMSRQIIKYQIAHRLFSQTQIFQICHRRNFIKVVGSD